MEVKRAFRCFKGPDDPGPFSDIINSMSFGCRHMKEFNKNGVFCLTANTPEGYVKVLRVGDVDYIWTEGRLEDYLVFASSWSPFIYYYTKDGELAWSVDPRIEGNYESWYQAAYEAYGGGFNLTDLYHGDMRGFDLQYMASLQWGFVWLLYRISHSGSIIWNWAFVHTEVENTSRYNCEFAITRFSGAYRRMLVGMTTWLHRRTSYPWFRSICDLYIYDDIEGTAHSLRISNSGADGAYFSMWGARWMEDDFFYVDIYTNKEDYLAYPRWSTLYKIDYLGNILATADQFQFPNNSSHVYKFDTSTGRLRSNDKYVIHFSTYGQYIRVWDKDLNFVKNVSVDPAIGSYGRPSGSLENYLWCGLIGFIKDEVYILVGSYDWDFNGTEPGGYHTVYVYDISKDSGDEFVRTVRVYPPTVEVFGVTKAEVFDEGITLEGYNG